jgi:hypothetical protein
MSTKALKAHVAMVKSAPVAKPNFQELAKAGDELIRYQDELEAGTAKVESHAYDSKTLSELEAARSSVIAFRSRVAGTLASFEQGVEAYNSAGYDNYRDDDNEQLSRRFIGEHIAKMIGACAVAPHSPEMYARVMIEAIVEERIEEDGCECEPMVLAIEAAFRQVVRRTNKSTFAPSLPVVLEALAKQQPAWRKRIEYAANIEGWFDGLIELLDERIAKARAVPPPAACATK